MPKDPRGYRKGVFIRPELLPKLEHYWKSSKRKAPDFTNFVNDLLADIVETEKFQEIIAPRMTKVGLDQDNLNCMYIKDEKENKIVEVFLNDNKLYCEQDRSKNCDHVMFALLQPEVSRLQIKKPSRRPESTKE
jgi:hypothetical protein